MWMCECVREKDTERERQRNREKLRLLSDELMKAGLPCDGAHSERIACLLINLLSIKELFLKTA